MRTYPPIQDRFEQNYFVEPNTGCFFWTGAKMRNGYGKIWYQGKKWLAHRIAWLLAHGSLAPDILVLHRCDNRSCVNDNHLFLGDHSDNSIDASNKGRLHGNRKTAGLWNKVRAAEHCKYGHTAGWILKPNGNKSMCKECANISRRKWRAKRKELGLPYS